MTGRTNWAGNVEFAARRLHRPTSVDELRGLVAGSSRVRALGTGHSFSRVADTRGDLVCLAGLPAVAEVDAERATVTVSAGMRYGELAARLRESGRALPNLGSLPQISVVGACATGTHGSGDRNGNLATAVCAMELLTAGGDSVLLRRDADGDELRGAVVGLGALGVVVSLTLELVPAFDVRQYVYEGLPRGELDADPDGIFSAAYSVSLFTDWRGPWMNQVLLKCRVDEGDDGAPPPRWRGATLADGPRHPVPGMSAANCTEQGGVAGPWNERLPHFRPGFTPSSGEELQSEYFVPRALALDALDAVYRVRDRVVPVLQVSEIRTVAADELWLSPAYRRDSVAIHFTWIRNPAAVAPALAAVEGALAPFAARPHWGKLFGTAPRTVHGLYERLPDFRRLVRRYDPAGTFGNEFVDRYVLG